MELTINRPFKGNYRVSFEFGEAPAWYTKVTGYPHNGIDFAMVIGVPILACDDGVISYADNVPDSNGLGININHDWGMSQYWHLSKLIAKMGATVKRGDLIGLSGDTGWATGPHLHFAIKVKEISNEFMRGWTDPAQYFGDPNYPLPPVEPAETTHVVVSGDTLWGLAVKYYGDGTRWPEIYKANRGKIFDPRLIYPAQLFTIP